MSTPDYRYKLKSVVVLTGTVSKCNICGQFFDSKKELKEHKDKSHRITDAKLAQKEPDHHS
jgi:uncharacterized C2H2 Zn-finger protein